MPTMDQSNSDWFSAGLASTFPSIDAENERTSSKTRIAAPPPDPWDNPDDFPIPPCKIYLQSASSDASANELTLSEAQNSVGVEESQVLIFRYRDKIHAIDHACPHRAYPLSRGSIHDIEDFGIVLSAGISCPKHGWSFDLHTGESDRGQYKLRVWDVEMRKNADGEEEVWIRKKTPKKKRIG